MIIPINSAAGPYNIILERGAIKKAGEYSDISEDRKVLIVTDSGVPTEYVRDVTASFKNSFVFTFTQGEKNKSLDTYRKICRFLSDETFTRKDAVIAVGGGVVGDLAGFAAATYMRGIGFYNIPTTLLSQLDSSVGGKTAVNLDGIKNVIGAFYPPKKVIIDPDVLSTLPERQIRNGFAEAVKLGVTMDEELFGIFEEGRAEEKIEEVIERSILIKKRIVEEDEKEGGVRKVLNFGHTIGHAIEASIGCGELYHGECVALGMIPMCDEKIRDRVVSVLKKTGLPTEFTIDREKVSDALIHDKKSEGEELTAVISKEIGTFEFIKTDASSLMKLI